MESLKTFVNRSLLIILGFTAMATQVILIRESLALFDGNELIIGLFLGIWMLLTALGSFLASRVLKDTGYGMRDTGYGIRLRYLLFILLSILSLSSLFLLIILRFALVPAGVMPGLLQTALVIFLAFLPFCLLSGMLFPILVEGLSSGKGKSLLHQGYALDSAGSILGGILFSLVFIFRLPPYESLVLLLLIGLGSILAVALILKHKVLALSVLILGTVIFYFLIKPEPVNYLDKKQFNKQKIIEIKSSPYGMLAVTRMEEQLFIYENGVPVSLGDNPQAREESVHYAMLMHPSPEKVLVISGATMGIIGEILKYPVTRVDYVDPNPWLIRIIEKYKPFPEDKRVNFIFKDPRIFLGKTEEKYDVILVNTPEPSSAEMNRFYTLEFYKLLKNRLNPGGIISVSIPAAGNYMNETSRKVHSVNYNTLQAVFNHIKLIPGGKDYFLASDSAMEQLIFVEYQSKGIENDYVNPSYINEGLLNMRSDLIMKDILPDEPVNRDLKPYVFSLFLRNWLEQFKLHPWVMPLILILILILSLFFLGPLNLGLFAGGFTSSALEFLLLIWFQVIFGFVYQMIGVIFAVFMAGIVLGSLFRHKILKGTYKNFLLIQGMMAFFSALTALTILLFSSSPLPPFSSSPLPLFSSSPLLLVPILVFLAGALMGMQFSLSAGLRKSHMLKSAGESFSADLLGSAIGILLAAVYLVPQFGLPATGFMLAGLNVVVLGVVAWKGR